MSDRPNVEETREPVSEAANSDAKSGVDLLMPLISVLARRIATGYGPDNGGHADLSRWGYQVAFLLGAVALYFLLRN